MIRDIIHVLSRRCGGFHLLLSPVRVQGAEAPLEIAKAIEEFNQYQLADVLIVGRGGGSLEDLWAFNDERVAKAIFESKIPIVSAVGHETDITLADFVADVRAPTPSAAAEIVTAEKTHHLETLYKTRKNIHFSIVQHFKRLRAQLGSYERLPLFQQPYGLLAQPMQKLDDLKFRMDARIREILLKKSYSFAARRRQAIALKPTLYLTFCKNKLKQVEKSLQGSFENQLKMRRLKLKQMVQRLEAMDPKNVLKRGYAILFAENENSAIVSAQMLFPGQKIRALLFDGKAKLTVDHE